MWRKHSIGILLFLLIVAGWITFYKSNTHTLSISLVENFEQHYSQLNRLMSSADERAGVSADKRDEKQQSDRKNSTEVCPDQKTYTGKYRNWVYGFSVVIPTRLKGYWNSAGCAPDKEYGCICMGDHGRFIPLSDDAHIEAFVSYKMEDEWSVSDYENDEVSGLRQKQGVEQVKVLSSKWVRLGNLKGRRFVVQFIEKNQNVVIDHIIALHEDVEYELILQTPEDRYPRDSQEFEKVIASWRLTPRV